MPSLKRLRRIRSDEIWWRARAAGRIHRDRLAFRLRAPRWDRRVLGRVLSSDAIDPFLTAHLHRQDWIGVQRALTRGLTSRPSRFVIDPMRAAELRSTILARWPAAEADADQRADRLRAGRLDLLGYRDVSFENSEQPIDWQFDPVHDRRPPDRFWADVPYLDPACGDHKIIWELNRHQHWLALGRALWLARDRSCGWTMVEQLTAWLAANPPLRGINWASSLELAFRSLSWVWALHFILADAADGTSTFDSQPWLVDLLIGLDRQLTQVERNLSHYFSPNTHLTGEALALYVAGQALPELRRSSGWVDTGRQVLLREIDRQIAPDGGHAERSLHYHRYTLDFYLLAFLVAERSGDTVAAEAFRDAASRLATFARGMADDRGRFALIGDDDGGMLWPIVNRNPADVSSSLGVAAVALNRPDLSPSRLPEEACWLCGPDATAAWPAMPAIAPPVSTFFADTGYAVMRDDRGGHAIFDAGAHGYLNGGHAHADALALTLQVNGVPLLIDPGTASYTMDLGLRDRMRDATSHNTLTVDDQSPSVPSGPFHWQSRTDAQLTVWRQNPRFDWAVAHHDSYDGLTHRRHIVHGADGSWLVVDAVHGKGRHAADLYWHFDPRWTVTSHGKHRLRAVTSDGDMAWLLHDQGGVTLVRADDEGIGWSSPCYGTLVPSPVARFSRHFGAPASFLTWIRAGDGCAPELERLTIAHDPGAGAIAARVIRRDSVVVTLLRPDDAPRRDGRQAASADFNTDGRLLQYELQDGHLKMLAMADASHALAIHGRLPSIACDGHVDDLAATFDAEAISLWATTPPRRLQLQGLAVAHARYLHLNGRELPLRRGSRVDSIVVTANDWADAEPERTICVA